MQSWEKESEIDLDVVITDLFAAEIENVERFRQEKQLVSLAMRHLLRTCSTGQEKEPGRQRLLG
ncbi:MAG: hypothetical protein ACLTRS_02705 [Lachnospiraceae bacterium]